MRKIILQLAISLDGFIEDSNGEYDWCFMDQDYGMADFLKRIDTIFLGRKTYDMMKAIPVNPDDPFTSSLAHVSQYVFSNSLDTIPVNASYHLINKNSLEWINEYKQSPGKDIWLFGGAGLTSSLFHAHFVDELVLAVHPILLGSGKSFAQGLNERVKLEFAGSTTYDTGLVMMRYTVKQIPV
jgi:dihydrofolate reductase